ncbi:multi-component transcriptional regulator, winged helix family (plasmid) [Trichormus variabilis ATCC 29413]|uniref:Multi-component transcriptional regulator, winged helix family n=2 Tax=Anabaena variabilis TaxID=264691 RepID=Q3M194_TRIV2|nr:MULTISPECIES: response regulator [Nostocaceae]ABA25249.1 multi-component transcriptional regulator, winged helix family [Trichormus variabilis ATCC 29413]MBC1218323.1 response regulator [Trichormus variabilis ARAD]MBC1259615.1 response regulator [Trichormus variabilis V5]MBC1271095.1 response regulator [Trichormus variabilis FSR]MBC1305849.1 response regulator [Trichormus variabilis N2B]
MKLLIVENDRDTAAALTTSLVAQQFTVDTASDSRSALELAEATEYDLIVLDVMLPDENGIRLCRQLRTQNQQEPILLLTRKVNPADRIAGFEAGADDYITKPYELSELLARIRALLRRGSTVLTKVLCWGQLQLDPNNCEVMCQGKGLHLTPKEYKLLELFLRHPRRIFDRRTLLDRICSIDECPGEEAITTQIRGLRRKLQMAGLNSDPIETLYGLGYRLKSVPEEREQGSEQGHGDTETRGRGDTETRGQGDTGNIFDRLSALPFGATSRHKSLPSGFGSDAPNVANAALTDSTGNGATPLKSGNPPTGVAPQVENATSKTPTSSPQSGSVQGAGSPHLPISAFSSSYLLNANRYDAEAEAVAAIQQMWQDSQERLQGQLAKLEEAIAHLSTNSLTPDGRQFAQTIAHRLIGSLGAFGMPQAAELARQIERTLKTPTAAVQSEEAVQLKSLLGQLRQVIQQLPTFATTAPTPVLKSSDRVVLLIDDDTDLIERMQANASNWSIHLETVTDLTLARQRLQYLTPDAIILDLTFPNTTESGLTLLAQLKHQFSTIPVLVLTGLGDLTKRVEVTRLGANAFLQKPATPTEVFQAVSQLLHRIDTINARLLIVDDDPALLSILEAQLQPWGFQVTTLADSSQFWQYLEATTPDLLLLDVAMPGFSGIELCQVVKSDPRWSRLPVLLLSAHADADTLYRALAAGADDYILKPIVEADLIQRILNFNSW